MRRALAALLAAVALAVLQTSGVGAGFHGVRPDLLLLFVLAAGMRGGETAGAAWGVGLGFLQDSFSAGLPGTAILTKGLAGLAAGSLRERLDCDNPNTQALVAAAATLAEGAVHLALLAVFSEGGRFVEPLLAVVVPAAALHGALLPAALAARRAASRGGAGAAARRQPPRAGARHGAGGPRGAPDARLRAAAARCSPGCSSRSSACSCCGCTTSRSSRAATTAGWRRRTGSRSSGCGPRAGSSTTATATCWRPTVPASRWGSTSRPCATWTRRRPRLPPRSGSTPRELARKLRAVEPYRRFEPVRVKEDVDRGEVAALEALRYEHPGVLIEIEPRRSYPHGTLAAHVLGYVGQISAAELKTRADLGYRGGDSIGKMGIEKQLDADLRGRDGFQQVEVDSLGRGVRVLTSIPAVAGRSVTLTLDLALQQAAEAALAGRAGAVVAIDPRDGAVLAAASSPPIDPNDFSHGLSQQAWDALNSDPLRPLQNRFAQAQYPPGSVFKIVTAVAALETEAVTPATSFYCRGAMRYGNRDFRCWKRAGHGEVSLHRALVESCDVYFYQAGLKTGIDGIARDGAGPRPGPGHRAGGPRRVPGADPRHRLEEAGAGGALVLGGDALGGDRAGVRPRHPRAGRPAHRDGRQRRDAPPAAPRAAASASRTARSCGGAARSSSGGSS